MQTRNPLRKFTKLTGVPSVAGTLMLAILFSASALRAQEAHLAPPPEPAIDGEPSNAAAQPDNATQSATATQSAATDSTAQNTQNEPRVALGVFIDRVNRGEGARVVGIAAGSPAETAGLRPSDEILRINGKVIRSHAELIRLLRDMQADTDVTLTIARGDQVGEITARLAARDAIFNRDEANLRERRAGFRGDTGEKTGVDKHAWLGVVFDEGQADGGAKIQAVFPGGPASRAGLREGDVVTRVGDKAITTYRELAEFIQNTPPDSETKFTIRRGDGDLQIPVRLGARILFADTQPQTYAQGSFAQGSADASPDARPQRTGRYSRDDMFGSIPEQAMVLEQNRQLSIQNERLERLILQVLQDVQALRAELATVKRGAPANGQANPASPPAGTVPQPENRETP